MLTAWHWPQTFPTQEMPGGAAPWLPWQSLQVGAERSPFSDIIFQCTLCLYFSAWSVGVVWGCMVFPSAWPRPRVSAPRVGWTLDLGSDGGRIEWAGWQLTQTATLESPNWLSRCPCTEVLYSATWSTRSEGLYCLMKRPSEWQRPHTCASSRRPGLPI